MSHTARFLNHDEFLGYVDSGAFERLYYDSKPHMDLNTVDYQYIIDQANTDLVADSLSDDMKYNYWLGKFSAYVDPNTVHDEDRDYRMMARCVGDHLLELKCCIKDGEELIVCNTFIGNDPSGSKVWLYSDAAGKAFYSLVKNNGCNYIVNIITQGSKIAFILQNPNSYKHIENYVDRHSMTMEEMSQTYNFEGHETDITFIKHKLPIKDF